jgi:hypothetical protein
MTYYLYSRSYKTEELSKAHPVGIDYLVRNEQLRNDFTRFIPAKAIEWIRADWGAPHGYTYIGHNKAWLNELLQQTPEFKKEVDAHECDHCPVELTTRYISRERVKEEPREDIKKRLSISFYYYN